MNSCSLDYVCDGTSYSLLFQFRLACCINLLLVYARIGSIAELIFQDDGQTHFYI
jgi:hypothetical protein